MRSRGLLLRYATPNPTLATTSAAALSFRQISAGGSHTCGITTDDIAYCWGLNNQGQLGDGSTAAQRERPVLVRGDFAIAR